MNNEFYVTIANNLYNDTKISNEELVIYTLIKRNYVQIKEVAITSINILMQYMCVNNRNPRLVKTIKEAISGLIEKRYIKDTLDLHYNHTDFKNLKNNDVFYVEIEPLLKQYFQIYDYDLDRIFDYLNKKNINKFNFIRYFITTQRVVSNQSKFGFLTQNSIKEIVGENKTVSKYNKILQDELKIIRYNNNYMTEEKHYTSTFFGRYGDKENFEFQLKNKIKDRGLVKTDKLKSNLRRSNTQKINKTTKKINKTINDDEILEMKAKLKELQLENKKLKYKKQEEQVEQEKQVEEQGKIKVNIDDTFNEKINKKSSWDMMFDEDIDVEDVF